MQRVLMWLKLKLLLGCFWAYIRQPHNHIDWATSIPFASINPIDPRTNLLAKIFWKLAILKNSIFLSRLFWTLKKICFISMKICQRFFDVKDGTKFWWLPWFPAKNYLPQTFQRPVQDPFNFWNTSFSEIIPNFWQSAKL